MKDTTVKDLMVPLSEYATVSEKTSLGEAILVLDKFQKEFDPLRHRHRAILVFNEENKIVGKVSMLDLLKALEPKYETLDNEEMLSGTGLSPDVLKSMIEQYALWGKPLRNICTKAAGIKVRQCMYTPSPGEYIDENVTLDVAVHKLIIGLHHSLIVTSGDDITGILRLSDVFTKICEEIKACEI